LAEEPATESARAATHHINAATAIVAQRLGNTPVNCKNSYVYPGVYEAFRDGSLARAWQRNASRWTSLGREDERIFLWVLRRKASPGRLERRNRPRTAASRASPTGAAQPRARARTSVPPVG
ncbi:MAG TPA: hypothetical protein PJ994_04330, partial [Tepidiformaceae bacterium]|nr:hypothetical protein [Tepidiformaceae bacterium]